MSYKRGFTLAEVVVTLGIIGIASALMGVAIGNAMPDKNKMKVVNLHQSITSITENLLDNNAIYYKKGSNDTCYGLGCQYQPLTTPYNSSTYSGTNKYGYLLAANMKLKASATSSNSKVNFTTGDGVKWTINTSSDGNSIITIDLSGDSGKNCSYNKTSCPKPDTFQLYVDKYGLVKGNDPLTTAYLSNPLKMNDKKNDLKTASADKTTYKTSP